MMDDYCTKKLLHHGIKATATRLLVFRQLERSDEMVSLPDLEHKLGTVDKSTISRTLTLFLRKGLIHAIDDGLGATKYALTADKGHIHFCCTQCERTFCLKNISTPRVSMPSGFTIQEIDYVIKGLCPECSLKA